MTDKGDLPEVAKQRLKWPLRVTYAGLLAERVVRAFWPLWTLVFFALAALLLGLHEVLPLEAVWALGVVVVLGGLTAFGLAVRRFRLPSRADALIRLDETLPGRPISTLADEQAIGAGDAASEAVWRTHVARMADRLKGVQARGLSL